MSAEAQGASSHADGALSGQTEGVEILRKYQCQRLDSEIVIVPLRQAGHGDRANAASALYVDREAAPVRRIIGISEAVVGNRLALCLRSTPIA